MIRTFLVAITITGIAMSAVATASASPNSGESTQSTTSSDVYYPNCAAARQAGVTPILAGQAGYRAGLDRDGDGIACE